MIDNHLRWDAQVKRVSKSFAAKVSQLKRMRFLPVKVQEEIYFKTIIAAVTYAVTVWGTCPPALFNDLEKIHVRAAKIIHQIPSHSDKVETMNVARWDSLDYIYKRKILAIMHKLQYKTIPEAIQDHFKKRLSHSRDGCSFNLPRIHKEIGRTSVIFRGTLLWNTVSLETRKTCSLQQFKNKIHRDKKLITSLSFGKETCLIRTKRMISTIFRFFYIIVLNK